MKLKQTNNETLEVSGLKELSGAGASTARDSIKHGIGEHHLMLNVDLSQITFVDSSGLGALISLHKTMRSRGGQLRLVNPSLICQQLLELTRLHRTFEIIPA